MTMPNRSIAAVAIALIAGIALVPTSATAKPGQSIRLNNVQKLIPDPGTNQLNPNIRKLKSRCVPAPVPGDPRKRKLVCIIG